MRLIPRLLRVAKRVLPARNLHLCTRATTSRIKLVGGAAVLTGLLVQHSAGEAESSQLSVDLTCEEVSISPHGQSLSGTSVLIDFDPRSM